jgi:Mn2+/Fe2+ NRAMP family transporter
VNRLLGLGLGIVTAIGGFLDAGSIVTAGQAGAQFGLGLVWALALGTIAIILLVEMVGRFSAVSKKAYAEAVREHLGFKFYVFPLAGEAVAETVLLAAEISGVAVALTLVSGVPLRLALLPAALLVLLMVWRAPFSLIENGPALLGLVTLSFYVAIVALGGPRPELLRTLVAPPVDVASLGTYLQLSAAILGATISPYLLYFYSSGTREEDWSSGSLGLNRATAVLGMTFGAGGAIALMFLAGMVLRPTGASGEAIEQLATTMSTPLGEAGTALFAAALFATCLGAALEVSLALGYDVAQGFGWEWGEDRPPSEAARFNLTLVAVVVIATVLGLLAGNPAGLALIGSTLIALFLPLSLFPFLVIMNDRRYLAGHTNGPISNLATSGILGIAFVVAVASIPLTLLGGSG